MKSMDLYIGVKSFSVVFLHQIINEYLHTKHIYAFNINKIFPAEA